MKKFGQGAHVLTLDAGSHAFKLVVSNRYGKGAFVRETVECAPTAEALQALVAERGWKGCPVRLVAQEPDLVWRHSFAPKLAHRLTTSALELETRKFATADLARCHWDYRPMEAPRDAEDDRLSYQVAVVHAATAEQLVALARAAGLKPMGLLPLPEVLKEAVDPARTQEQAVALLDLGALATRVVILHRGEPVLFRTLGVGGQLLTEELRTVMVPGQAAFTFSTEEAEELKRRHGLSHDTLSLETEALVRDGRAVDLPLAQVGETLRPLFERLVRELYSTIDYWRERSFDVPFGEVRLAGGGALLPGLPEYLATVLGVPVEVAAPPMLVGLEQERAIPAGAAAGALVAPLTALDLLEPRPATPLEQRGRPLTTSRVAAVLLLTVGLGFAGGLWRLGSEQRALKGAQARLNGQESRADLLRRAGDVEARVLRAAELRRTLAAGAPDWPAILAGLSRQVTADTRLTAMNVEAAAAGAEPTPPRLLLSGVVTGDEPAPAVLARLLTSLHDVPGIGPAELVSATPNDEGNELFEIRSPLLNGGLQ